MYCYMDAYFIFTTHTHIFKEVPVNCLTAKTNKMLFSWVS